MVKVQEFDELQVGNIQEIKDDDYEDIEEDIFNESIVERLCALVDIVPPVIRVKVTHGLLDLTDFLFSAAKVAGSGLWILSTASLMVLLPMALELEREKAVMDQEMAQRIQQQQAQQLMASTETK